MARGRYPGAVKLAFQGSTLTLLWQLFRQAVGAATFDDDEDDLGLADAMDEAGLALVAGADYLA